MIKKLLIANRGEIALRIIRACRELDIETIAVYSDADRNSLPVRFADRAVNIGKSSSLESYLNIKRILQAAHKEGADAIHPGYGFLSENSGFAVACNQAGLKFIGPPADIIESMGNKIEARKRMKAAGVPIIPGSIEPLRNDNEVIKIADKIGYPVILKASAGGGGKGLRVVNNREELISSLPLARQEAKTFFADDTLYLEKYISRGKHIEVQLLADDHKNIVHLGERDCSIQRRHQKLIEESPSPALDKRLRRRIHRAALKAAKAVGYSSAGTVEFLLDENRKFYFLEMNTRIQVEHPVSELVSGVDLVKAQLLISSGAHLSYKQRQIQLRGHSIECRINAEDPTRKFFPSPGKVKELEIPGGPGVRVDTHLYRGYKIPHHYDPMIAKVIVWAENRISAISRMQRALKEFRIEGIKTNIHFHLEMLSHIDFFRSRYDTDFINKSMRDYS